MRLTVPQRIASAAGLERYRALQRFAGHLELPPRRIRAMQLASLRGLLRYAERRVPYYRDLFGRLKITARDIRSVEDLRQLPVLTRAIIAEQGDRMISEEYRDRRGLIRCTTGGSTGKPTVFYKSWLEGWDVVDAYDLTPAVIGDWSRRLCLCKSGHG